MSKASLFLKSSAPDFILCLVVSVGLVLTVSFGFESAPELRKDMVLIASVNSVLLAVLFLGAWSKRMVPVSGVLFALAAVVSMVAIVSFQPEGATTFERGVLAESADNYIPFAITVAVTPLLVYLLSRRRMGVIVLLFVSIIVCESITFLYRDWTSSEQGNLISLVVFAGVGALFVFQTYRTSVVSARRVKSTHFAGATAFSLGVSLACVGVGAALFLGVISGLGLQTLDIKPFTEEYSRPVVEYSGVYAEQQVEDPDKFTNKVNEDQSDSNQDADGGEDSESPKDDQETGSNPLANLIQEFSNFDQNSWDQMFDAIAYDKLALNASILLVLIVAVIYGLIRFQKSRRTKRLEKIANEDDVYKIWYLWTFLEKRFARLGIKRPENLTLLEFAMVSRAQLQGFSKNTQGIDYLEITLAYQRAVYGVGALREGDYEKLERFYNVFFDNAKAYVGKVKWKWYFWRL